MSPDPERCTDPGPGGTGTAGYRDAADPVPDATAVEVSTPSADARPGRGRRSLPSQVDPTTCGIAALAAVTARAGVHPAYLDAPRVRQAQTQRSLHALAARTGAPWPRAWGTSPWALARLAGRATGHRYGILPWGPSALVALDAARARGEDSFLYVGGGSATSGGTGEGHGPVRRTLEGAARALDRWGIDIFPRHVVALLGDDGPAGSCTVFEPSSGHVREVPCAVLEGPWPLPGREFGHWARPLLAVTPVT